MKRFVFFFLLAITIPSLAQKSKLKQLEQQKKEIMREINSTNQQLKETERNTSTLVQRMKLISNQISNRKKMLSLLSQEMESIDVEQSNIELEIEALEAELREKQKNYAKAIESIIANRHNGNGILFVLSGKSITKNFRRFKYLKDYSEWRSKEALNIKEKSLELNKKKIELAETKTSKQTLVVERKREQDALEKEESGYQVEIQETKKKQKELQAILIEKQKKANALNNKIAKLIAEEVARRERSNSKRSSKRSGSTKRSSTPKNASTPSVPVVREEDSPEDVQMSNNFASNKGRLPYPISGSTTIINTFGTHQHSQYVTTNSNGIDIRSQAGSQARAVFNGEVSRIVAFPGYNNCIIVRHGNYYTFYGNIQTVAVSQGQQVTTGQSLGQVYNDSDLGGCVLHFQLWHGNNKMNPTPWLRK